MPSSHLSVQGLVNSQSNHSNGGFVESNKSQDRVICDQDFEEIDLSRGDDRGVHAETMRHQANHFKQSYPYVVLDDAYMPTYSHYNLQYSEKWYDILVLAVWLTAWAARPMSNGSLT